MIPAHALLVGVFGCLLGCAAVLVLFGITCVWAWLFGSEQVDAALASSLTDDDEPVPYLPIDDEPECAHPECEQARQLARLRIKRALAVARVRQFTAIRGRAEWTEQDEEALAEYERSIGGGL